ncbi:MAG: hypothetical protein CMJ65_02135 [Planctomycetaceae bacterium]|nr:hypothetical protein [Planctomycetaceae bacterium]
MNQTALHVAASSHLRCVYDLGGDQVFSLQRNSRKVRGCPRRVVRIAAAFMTLLLSCFSPIVAGDVAPGEIAFEQVKDERPRFLRLLSGKLFRVNGKDSQTSVDGGKTWQRGGQINPLGLGWKLKGVAIQLRSAKYRGRIVVPFYFGMYGNHPDYTTTDRGGYAIWKGKKILLETHTHIPEMSGSFVCYSDDEGKTWQSCVSAQARGFMVGYFKDGHLGHLTCEEPVVAELKDGRLLCFMRSTCGRILKSYSSDGGKNWLKVQLTDLAMSSSPAMLKRLPRTGDLVMVWNQMSAEEIKRGYRRGRLTIAISRDEGQTWIHRRNLEVSPGIDGKVTQVKPPPLRAMVRGGSGPNEILGEIPDGFMHYHYPTVFLSEDKIFINYGVTPPEGSGTSRWRVFPIAWLYSVEK